MPTTIRRFSPSSLRFTATPRRPACATCPLAGFCAALAQGIAADLPRKTPKKPKPTRRGIAYVALRADGAPLVETRPPRGLLGGMPGFPGTDWVEDPAPAPPLSADWRLLDGTVRHSFTHFHLDLTVALARVPLGHLPERGAFRPGFDPSSLPTVMRKVWDHAAMDGLFRADGDA